MIKNEITKEQVISEIERLFLESKMEKRKTERILKRIFMTF